jgi:hypothetical protein
VFLRRKSYLQEKQGRGELSKVHPRSRQAAITRNPLKRKKRKIYKQYSTLQRKEE